MRGEGEMKQISIQIIKNLPNTNNMQVRAQFEYLEVLRSDCAERKAL